jgi:peptidoglycan/LPS O-acetylase OafA/YrhL
MDKPMVRYRVTLTLLVLGLSGALALANSFLPAAFQPFAWGVTVGLLYMYAGVAIGWAAGRSSSIVSFVVLAAILGVRRQIFPVDWQMFAGEITGILLVIVMVLVAPLRTLVKPTLQRRTRTAPLEESSPHRMILPRTNLPHADNSGEKR